jgi:hypothetical protein
MSSFNNNMSTQPSFCVKRKTRGNNGFNPFISTNRQNRNFSFSSDFSSILDNHLNIDSKNIPSKSTVSGPNMSNIGPNMSNIGPNMSNIGPNMSNIGPNMSNKNPTTISTDTVELTSTNNIILKTSPITHEKSDIKLCTGTGYIHDSRIVCETNNKERIILCNDKLEINDINIYMDGCQIYPVSKTTIDYQVTNKSNFNIKTNTSRLIINLIKIKQHQKTKEVENRTEETQEMENRTDETQEVENRTDETQEVENRTEETQEVENRTEETEETQEVENRTDETQEVEDRTEETQEIENITEETQEVENTQEEKENDEVEITWNNDLIKEDSYVYAYSPNCEVKITKQYIGSVSVKLQVFNNNDINTLRMCLL